MTKVTRKLSKWREYFRSSTLDIFNVIEYALRVAAIDHSKEFKLNRDKITELIYSFKGFDCDNVVPNVVDDKGTKKSEKNEIVMESKDCDVKKEKSKSNSSNVEAEKLCDEIDEASRVAKEVLSIKKIIDNSKDEADSNIYKSLKRLQLMAMSVETLQDTEIGKSVNALKRHNSKNIRYLAKTIVKDWKQMVHEWADACAAVTEGRDLESTKAFVVDEEGEGFPVPPWEELPFISTHTGSINLSKIFDDMNDDGNDLSNKKDEQEKKQTSLVKPNKPPAGGNSGSGRPTKPTLERKLNNDHEMKLQKKSDKSKIQARPVSTQQNKLKCPDQDEQHVKFEATKRKLQERYQEAEKAKRQRRIQVHDIPKQGRGVRNTQMRQGNHSRPIVNRRQ